jgi:uncharacterized protein
MKPAPSPFRTTDWIVLAIALALPTAVTWLYFVALDGADKTLQQGAYTIGKAIQFALPIVWLGLIQKQALRWPEPTTRGLVAGGLLGLAIAATIFVLYFALLKDFASFAAPAAAVRLKVQSFGISSVAAFLAVSVFYSALHSLLEEYYWRWFVFGQVRRASPLPAAIAISSIAFAAHHVLVLAHYFGWASLQTWLFSACVAIGGALWAFLYDRTRSIYAPWLSHAFVDAAIFAIGYDVIT